MAINNEQERVIAKLEELLKFFRGSQIKNEDSLFIINEGLDNLMSSLKYLPTEPSFDSLPTEIKTDILSYLCDSGAFVAASVSQNWKGILQRNLKQLKQVNIGKHCIKCEDNACFMPEEVLKASITHNLDVPLSVCYPLSDIDTNLVVEGLTSVSNLSIGDNCDCNWENEENDEHTSTLEPHQFKMLFEELEKKQKVMDNLQLINVDFVDLNQVNQVRLVNYLFNKVNKLTLECNGEMLDDELFIETLLHNSPDSKLTHLTLSLEYYDFSTDLSVDFADAVCKVENVKFADLPFHQENEMAKRLVQNIMAQNIRMKTLGLNQWLDWASLISPDELKTILEKMDALSLEGNFTQQQKEVAKSLPGIEVTLNRIVKNAI